MRGVPESAIASHKAGLLADAALLYEKLLMEDESNAPALHLLGVLRHQQGDDTQAIELLCKALAIRPNMPVAHANLSDAFRAQGDFERAVGSARLALKLWRDCPEALCNLGLALHAMGRTAEAAETLGRALELSPDSALSHTNLGVILRESGRADEAIGHFRRAAELDPAFVPALNNLAQMLIERGQPAEALPHCREAARLEPMLAAAQYTLGNALEALRRWIDARAAYLEALRIDPDMACAHAHLALTLLGELWPGEAVPWLKQAVELDPQNPSFHEWLGAVYCEWEEYAQAVPYLLQAIALSHTERADLHVALGQALLNEGHLAQAFEHVHAAQRLAPEAPQVLFQLGNLHEAQGEMAEAEAAFRGALTLRPCAPLPLARLANNLRGRLPQEDLVTLEVRLNDRDLNKVPRARLLFALAQVLDERGEYRRAAECAKEANSLVLQLARGWRVHDPAAAEAFVEGVVKAFCSELLGRTSGFGSDTRRPVFVVGLPRSGTTLVEQVLASHRRVHGAGELRLVPRSFESIPAVLGGPGSPLERVPDLDRTAIVRLAEQHLAWIAELDTGPVERVVDKLPANYMHLGLLATLFPWATVIHCRRDLRDVAVSCWMTDFQMVPWANEPDHIAAQFSCYQRLMDHWRNVLPISVYEVRYEDLVADIEGVARRLVAACGLEWDAKCLEFHTLERPVRTASVTQVRQPIYRRSVGRWKNYEHTLSELFAKLPAVEEPFARVAESAGRENELAVATI